MEMYHVYGYKDNKNNSVIAVFVYYFLVCSRSNQTHISRFGDLETILLPRE